MNLGGRAAKVPPDAFERRSQGAFPTGISRCGRPYASGPWRIEELPGTDGTPGSILQNPRQRAGSSAILAAGSTVSTQPAGSQQSQREALTPTPPSTDNPPLNQPRGRGLAPPRRRQPL